MNNKESFWHKFSTEVGADFIEGHYGKSDSAAFNYKSWKIIFDNYTHSATAGTINIRDRDTRIICTVSSKDNFHFEISTRNLVLFVKRLFRSRKVIISDRNVYRRYVAESNSQYKFDLILSNDEIRNKILELNLENIQLTNVSGIWCGELSGNKRQLASYFDRTITDSNFLIEIYRLFAKILDQLVEIDSI